MKIILNWLLSALSLMIVAHLVRGFDVTGFTAALLAALVIGLVNATLGAFLKLIMFPLTLLSLGIFSFVINALMLKLVALFVPGFTIQGFIPALFAAVVLSLVNLFLRIVASGVQKKL